MSEHGKIKNLGYFSKACGRSYYRVKCECGRLQDIYAWRGVKKCECGRLLSIKYSPEGREIQVTDRELGIVKQEPVRVTAPCVSCGEEVHYVQGFGWIHSKETYHDHPALPDYSKKETTGQ